MRTILMPVVLLLLTALPHQVLAQGMLGKIREDVREEEDEEEDCDEEDHGKRKKRAGNCGCDDGGRSIIDLGILFRLEGAEYHAFPAYPYPLGLPGYVQYDPTPVHAITGNPGDQLDLKD